jgi:hypothetical protein
MKCKLLILILISMCISHVRVGAQVEKSPLVAVPREIAFPVIAYQPDSPLEYQRLQLLARVNNNGSVISFELRNRGSKPIRSAAFAVWTSASNGSTDGWSGKLTGELVMPGQLIPSMENKKEIVPLNKELAEKLTLQGPMKAVVVFMVFRVEFDDGTTYSDEKTFKSLESYFNGLNGFQGR